MKNWKAIILAASRGPEDPMAKAFGTNHKCLIEVDGKPMLSRVLDTLSDTHAFSSKFVVIETGVFVPDGTVTLLPPQSTAARSAKFAVEQAAGFPVLITTGDHALLTVQMVEHVLVESVKTGADITVSLASAEVITHDYPETKRTFFRLGKDRVSGCNIFTVHSAKALAVFDLWERVEAFRKKPFKLIATFGLVPLLRFVIGRLSLADAFAHLSKKTGTQIVPLLLPFAEAAIDVDKPEDKELAEKILRSRRGAN